MPEALGGIEPADKVEGGEEPDEKICEVCGDQITKGESHVCSRCNACGAILICGEEHICTVLFETAEDNPHIGILTLNRPKGNTLNTTMLEALLVVLGRVNSINSNTEIRVLIMRSEGKHSGFGADLNELVNKIGEGQYTSISLKDAVQHIKLGRDVVKALMELRVPTIGIMYGFCLGGSFELYLACDVLFGASDHKSDGGLICGLPEPEIGLMAGWFGPENLIKRIGRGNAKYLLFPGRKIGAEQALRIGIIQELHFKSGLMEAALKWASDVANCAPLAVEATKTTVDGIIFPCLSSTIYSTGKPSSDGMMTADFVNGVASLLDKTKRPKYERE